MSCHVMWRHVMKPSAVGKVWVIGKQLLWIHNVGTNILQTFAPLSSGLEGAFVGFRVCKRLCLQRATRANAPLFYRFHPLDVESTPAGLEFEVLRQKKRAQMAWLVFKPFSTLNVGDWQQEMNYGIQHPKSSTFEIFQNPKPRIQSSNSKIPTPRSIYQNPNFKNPRTQKSNIQNQPSQVLPWYFPHIVSLLKWSNNR